MKPGIYYAMPDPEYRAIDALSNSGLCAWAKGEMERSISEKAAIQGQAFHATILEPDEAAKRIVGLEPKQKRASYEGSEDALVLTHSEYTTLMGCYQSVKDHPTLSKLAELARADRQKCEVVLVWDDPATGIRCKAKVDQLTDKNMYDWKTTQSTPDGFGHSIAKFFYNVQAAHYMSGAIACGLELDSFRFACVCKRKDLGHVCWLQDIDPVILSAGYSTWKAFMSMYARYGSAA